MKDWLTQHVAEGALLVVLAVMKWLGSREVNRIDKTHADHEQRLRAIESDRVTRADFDELRSSLTATIVHSAERADKRFDQIMQHLLRRP